MTTRASSDGNGVESQHQDEISDRKEEEIRTSLVPEESQIPPRSISFRPPLVTRSPSAIPRFLGLIDLAPIPPPR